jgi:hypothetical protein
MRIYLGPNTTLSDPINVTINPLPTIAITPPSTTTIPSGGSILLQATNDSGYSYQWYLNNSPIGGANSFSYLADAAGEYFVVVSNGCVSVSNTIILQNELGIGIEESNQFVIYPNPTKSELFIFDFKNLKSPFEIVNVLGQKVIQGVLSGLNTKIDVHNFKPGTYFLIIKNENENIKPFKFIVQN